ncbi:LCP family protein [Virgibacillus sp. 179-BFC.A HS]|uniref:LCP family protein n=1 Tax=Tigheibacillus jepli TaxID=3035914 RepID=A0ABU5CGT7_9BACI|nr:LCP family protein [Virgibacillus sp. 179-BFC.A HS]MDY0405072.1 LCP family protein [Virgibacillus sp. 179-BFC.A HS]
MRSRKETNKKKKRTWLKVFATVIVVIILLGGGYLFYLWNKLNDTVDTIHSPLSRDEDPQRQKELKSIFKNKQSINILLLGVDERAGDRGRSDTMILMSLNPNTDTTMMLSIPRDTYVNIPNRGMDKINHAYAYGGTDLSVKTVENTFDLPVHFYAKVNMEGFKQGINAIGGVTVNNKQDFTQDGKHFPVGEITLNGKDALKYIRMRKQDARGDLGRNERQRSVINAAMNKVASVGGVTKFGDILEILGDNVETDMNMDRFKSLFSDYRDTRKRMKTLEISGNGQIINQVWYYIVSDSEFNRITTAIKKHMDAK